MYKIKRFSKLYDQAKARLDRQEDYDIADIAAKKTEMPGKVAGAIVGSGLAAVGGRKLKGLILKNRNKKIPKLLNKYAPEILNGVSSNLGIFAAGSLGSNYGGKISSSATRKAILDEAEDRRKNPEKYLTPEEKSRLIGVSNNKRK